jgi:hypothetical protein
VVNHLRIKLINEATEEPVFGTNEEAALVNSIKTAFPESGHVLCIRHLKSNIKQKMIDDGIDRELLLDRIFADNGVVHADDFFR